MSAQEIIEEVTKLSREEREQVRAKLEELADDDGTDCMNSRDILLKYAGKAEGLPADMSVNLDHYLYGLPKRQP